LGLSYCAHRLNSAKFNGKSVFAFSPEQLSTLRNPKNLTAFLQFRGIEGLVNGLRSDQTNDLGAHSEEATNGFATRVSLEVAPSSSTSREGGLVRPVAPVTKENTAPDEDRHNAGLFAQKRAVFLDNRLPTKKQPSFLHLLWMAYNDPVLFLLTAAAAVSLAIGLYQY
jgi:P-type Ca2+ transporter type 2C